MLKPVYALVGSEPFLQLEKLGELAAQLPADAQRIDVDGERAELADVLDELRSFAMFGGGKLVIVRSGDEFITRFREQLEDYVAKPSNSATLVLRVNSLPASQRITKAIAKVGEVIPCSAPKDLARWIVDRGKAAHKIAVTQPAAQLLAELIGDDLGRLDNELAKLALQVTGTKVDEKDVATGTSFQREQEMWDMTNEIAAGNTAAALRRWRQLVQLDSSSEFRAVTWLGMWLEKARKALVLKKSGMNSFTIAGQLKIWPREMIQPFFETAERLGETGVARAIDLLVKLDHQSKSGVGDAAENVERFLLAVGMEKGC